MNSEWVYYLIYIPCDIWKVTTNIQLRNSVMKMAIMTSYIADDLAIILHDISHLREISNNARNVWFLTEKIFSKKS